MGSKPLFENVQKEAAFFVWMASLSGGNKVTHLFLRVMAKVFVIFDLYIYIYIEHCSAQHPATGGQALS
jgi:hypothetical protein